LTPHLSESNWIPSVCQSLWHIVSSQTNPQSSSDWVSGVQYSIGSKVSYNSNNYVCIAPHFSESNWTPSVCPSLWKVVSS
jgi:hypothetical protein